ncbi:Pkinase domain-containing protein [Cephalotus follicularis]|uniref:mitogen-activated protein kinase kinase kinase n=1 Tax=Cephalotus follicularis TaxID=3775 RepID=A0A1Q3BHJ5_CEPFO|nr:Pkinase domain-containing protein [Cephalotus follicularis]
MDAKQRKQTKPKLERRNAIKKTTSSPTRSTLNLSPLSAHCNTSFRIEGNEGEFDLICRTLGFSGPEDFSIPTAVWEAQKVRAASDKLRFDDEARVSSGLKQETEVSKLINGLKLDNFGSRVRVSDDDGRVGPSVELKHENEGQFEATVRVSTGNLGSRVRVSDEGCVGPSGDFNGEISEAMEPMHRISPNGKLRRTITWWQKGELLGSGSFGTVYEGFTHDGFFFAVKEVSLLDQGSKARQSIFQLEQEISLLSQFEHENIVQYLGTNKDDAKLYIFLELVTKGSLASLYQKYNLRDSQVSAYTRQILSGLKYLHERNVVHRDIKCANILVDVSGSVKLADFGLAKATKLNDVKSSKGTPFWMAPEVVNLKSQGYGLAADIWSLGCTVLEMLTCRPPYSHLEGMQALFSIGRGIPPSIPDSLSRDAEDFICQCLQVNPSNRPTAAQLLKHPFVRKPLSTPLGLPSTPYHRVRS